MPICFSRFLFHQIVAIRHGFHSTDEIVKNYFMAIGMQKRVFSWNWPWKQLQIFIIASYKPVGLKVVIFSFRILSKDIKLVGYLQDAYKYIQVNVNNETKKKRNVLMKRHNCDSYNFEEYILAGKIKQECSPVMPCIFRWTSSVESVSWW